MSTYPSLDDDLDLGRLFTRFPRTIEPLLHYHDLLLRGESALAVGERELIAAYVSWVNGCRYCFGAHSTMALAHDVAEDVIERIRAGDGDRATGGRLDPLLAYVRKLTEAPASIEDQDAQAVYDAGWSEEALFDAVSVCALFNFMNRIIEGAGIDIPAPVTGMPKAALRAVSYVDWGRRIGVVK